MLFIRSVAIKFVCTQENVIKGTAVADWLQEHIDTCQIKTREFMMATTL